MDKGYFQIYTGNGKGKTTSVLGLIVRAAGAGLKVYFGQFVKNSEYSEIKILKKRFPEVTVEQFGGKDGCFINREPNTDDFNSADNGYRRAMEALKSHKYDIVILDEINIALHYRIISEEQAMSLVDERPEDVELIFTGRYAPQKFIDRADLVSEINDVKHYFNNGVEARDGIES